MWTPLLVVATWFGVALLVTALVALVGTIEYWRHLRSLSPAARRLLAERNRAPMHLSFGDLAEDRLAALKLERREATEQAALRAMEVRRTGR